ncbi:unnamed protein product [Arctia plantaginis]|uniref:TRUD domain-containing protein n=1 Tax=Arctia plantaginis TaxID=874455 RepID=A0A8S1BLZ8_ARCPL|nr:unnamed protein product [Arctia plantaginis]
MNRNRCWNQDMRGRSRGGFNRGGRGSNRGWSWNHGGYNGPNQSFGGGNRYKKDCQPQSKHWKNKEKWVKRDSPGKRLSEDLIGVTEYISSHEGFNGIIKSRYSDFQVSEMNEKGEIAKLTDTKPPMRPSDEAVDDDEDLLLNKYNLEILPMETWDKINSLAINTVSEDAENPKVEIDMEGVTKEQRTKIHDAVKKAFGDSIVGSTVNVGDKKFMRFEKYRKGVRIDNRVKWVWPGEYVYFIVHKENCDTMDAAARIAERIGVHLKPSTIGYAGTKDRRAKTSQWFSAKRVDPARIATACRYLRDIHVGNFSFDDTNLKLGMLKGNKFRIALRNVTADQESVDSACQYLKDQGFINYYGLQRFGSRIDTPTFDIGLKLLQGKFKEAIDAILEPREGPLEEVLRVNASRGALAASALLPRRAAHSEARLIRALAAAPHDLVGALSRVPGYVPTRRSSREPREVPRRTTWWARSAGYVPTRRSSREPREVPRRTTWWARSAGYVPTRRSSREPREVPRRTTWWARSAGYVPTRRSSREPREVPRRTTWWARSAGYVPTRRSSREPREVPRRTTWWARSAGYVPTRRSSREPREVPRRTTWWARSAGYVPTRRSSREPREVPRRTTWWARSAGYVPTRRSSREPREVPRRTTWWARSAGYVPTRRSSREPREVPRRTTWWARSAGYVPTRRSSREPREVPRRTTWWARSAGYVPTRRSSREPREVPRRTTWWARSAGYVPTRRSSREPREVPRRTTWWARSAGYVPTRRSSREPREVPRRTTWWARSAGYVPTRRSSREPREVPRRTTWWARSAGYVPTRRSSREPREVMGAGGLRELARNIRLLYLHSYQSLVWNRAVSERIRRFGLKPVAGDCVPLPNVEIKDSLHGDSDSEDGEGEDDATPTASDSTLESDTKPSVKNDSKKKQKHDPHKPPLPIKILSQEDVDTGKYNVFNIVLPLPGAFVAYPPNMIDFYEEVLTKDGLKMDMKHKLKSYNMSGAYRHMVVRPLAVSWQHVRYSDPFADLIASDLDELDNRPITGIVEDGKYRALLLNMILPSSCYATMALRELLKVDTSSDNQALQNNYHKRNKADQKESESETVETTESTSETANETRSEAAAITKEDSEDVQATNTDEEVKAEEENEMSEVEENDSENNGEKRKLEDGYEEMVKKVKTEN